MTNKHSQALIRASGFYLTKHLTEKLLKGSKVKLIDFINEHLWDPFEYWDAEAVYRLITKLAHSFEELME